MKRRIIQIVVLLILGAIANVAVAWGFAVFVPFKSPVVGVSNESQRNWWVTHAPLESGLAEGAMIEWNAVVLSEMLYPFDESPDAISGLRIRAGWPMFSVDGSVWYTASAKFFAMHGVRPVRQHLVPLSPLWPGFAINTIFYAAILWALWFAPGAVRRMIRRRRGLCPACAYPIGTSEVCTECGNTVRLTAISDQKLEQANP